jgi:RNA polymerase sigma factor (TIGR02999 family)
MSELEIFFDDDPPNPSISESDELHGLEAIGSSDLDDLFSATYEELRRLARAVRRVDARATISPTTLVHEVWIRLQKSQQVKFDSETHFKRTAAKAMRHVVVEAARRRLTQRHGGFFVKVSGPIDWAAPSDQAIIALNDALNLLATVDVQQTTIVELRFFGGLNVAEVAEALHLSKITVEREWRVIKAWLAGEILRESPSE